MQGYHTEFSFTCKGCENWKVKTQAVQRLSFEIYYLETNGP
jgi:hypothetical protein